MLGQKFQNDRIVREEINIKRFCFNINSYDRAVKTNEKHNDANAEISMRDGLIDARIRLKWI